ncbi:Ankyrin repeat [Macleaya cordata]|uniref:Ankyrin repeat n=1 Tax=Macleaya cordata TaxID=56857 RepID=A0A200QZ39_MACCD|nr:Ankyrin repeat [Macleaya cordata]
MGASSSTLENDVEASISKLFENNIYNEGPPSSSSLLVPVSSSADDGNNNNNIETSLEQEYLGHHEQPMIIDTITPEYLNIDSSDEIPVNSDDYNSDAPAEYHLDSDLPDGIQLNNIHNYNSDYLTGLSPVIHTNIYYNTHTSDGSDGSRDPVKENLVLYKAALKGDWSKARVFLNEHPEAVTARITKYKETALHVAARSGHSMFVEKLVRLMPPESLEYKESNDDYTALHLAAITGITRVARALVKGNPNLTQIRDRNGWVPLLIAAYHASSEEQKELVKYLCTVTRDESHDGQESPFKGISGGNLIFLTTASSSYDTALYLLRRFPNLATQKNETDSYALEIISSRPSAFLSGSQLTSWQRFIYKFLRIKQVYTQKLMHKQALALVKRISEEISSKHSEEIVDIFSKSDILWSAVRHGVVELVMEYIQICPDLVWLRTNDKSILQQAIKHRRENVFALIYGMIGDKKKWSYLSDDNTILHLVAELAPSYRLYSISGAALQMQWELQWYKEVENFALKRHQNKTNKDGKRSRDIFTKEHKELMQKGEDWMKYTAQSCTLVATLIATVAFAAAFTVPGGNISDSNSINNGIPIFLNKNSFMVFAIANALALFSSITSVIIFLSILTARYAEQDFLKSLPEKLIIGLATLFFSIATMIVAFSATLSLVLGHRMAWVLIPIAFFACVPVALFLQLQLPLFVKMIRSTYGPSIFERQSQCMPCNWEY